MGESDFPFLIDQEIQKYNYLSQTHEEQRDKFSQKYGSTNYFSVIEDIQEYDDEQEEKHDLIYPRVQVQEYNHSQIASEEGEEEMKKSELQNENKKIFKLKNQKRSLIYD